MHTVCELRAFSKAAADDGMSEADVRDLIDYLSVNPMAGDEIAGTGGCRKFRWGGKGKGKRGAYRVITFYTGVNLPIFLVALFSKGEKVNLTKKEQNVLYGLTKQIVKEYQARVVKVSGRK
jgi:hypothetical protein